LFYLAVVVAEETVAVVVWVDLYFGEAHWAVVDFQEEVEAVEDLVDLVAVALVVAEAVAVGKLTCYKIFKKRAACMQAARFFYELTYPSELQ
jgi:hypothetical protein